MKSNLYMVALALVASAAVVAAQPTAVTYNAVSCKDISIGEWAEAGNFTTLAALLDATNLFDALNGTRMTIFAPTDTAFENALTALDTSVDVLYDIDNGTTLAALLTYHVSLTPLNLTTLQSKPETQVRTTAGLNLTVTYAANALSVKAGDNLGKVLNSTKEGEQIVQDRRCGVYVYPVDQVLLPPGTLALLTTAPAPAPAGPAKAPTAAITTSGRKLYV